MLEAALEKGELAYFERKAVLHIIAWFLCWEKQLDHLPVASILRYKLLILTSDHLVCVLMLKQEVKV